MYLLCPMGFYKNPPLWLNLPHMWGTLSHPLGYLEPQLVTTQGNGDSKHVF